MAETDHYDVLVLGSGEAGKYLSWAAGKAGMRTAVVERRLVGGSCPNIACLPSKNVIHSAKVASFVARREEFGVHADSVRVDMAGVYRRKREMVDGLVAVHLDRYRTSGVDLIFGEGRLVGPRTIAVALRDGGERTLTGERVFLSLGSRAAIPDVPGLAEARPMTHVEALDLDRLPEHLVVLGGGYVALELAQATRRFGARVTVVEHGPRLAPREDPDVSDAILALFRDEGIEVMLGAEPVSVDGVSGEGVRVEVRDAGGTRTAEGSDLLVALGRTPNTRNVGLERAGIEVTPAGHVRVNDRLETTAPNVWAVGDCAGSPYFTHAAYDDYRLVWENLNGGDRSARDRLVPSCLFVDPPLARVGLTETEARERGVAYRLATLPTAAVLKTRTISEPRGFMKALVAADDDRVLGFAAFGPEAGELMATVQVAILAGLPYTALRDAIFAHPTMTEGLVFLFANVPARA